MTEREDRVILQSELSEEWKRVLLPPSTSIKKKGDMLHSFVAALHDELGLYGELREDVFSSESSSGYWRETMILGRVQLLTGVRRTGAQPDTGKSHRNKNAGSGGTGSRRAS